MAKKKTSKAAKTKKEHVKKINPFELKFNRVKHNVLGQKKTKGVMGRPGLSKKKAYEQREKTLGIEHSRLGVVNKIVDRRIGEKDANKSSEEKASMRYMAEKMKNFNKVSKFNLTENDEMDVLTHGGETLTSIQKYDRIAASDDDDDAPGDLGAQMVKMAHFGGGEEVNDAGKPKNRKDVIAELILKTKQNRQEKQMAKDDQETLTENLDQKYKNLLGKISSSFRPIGATKNESVVSDDYDKITVELKLSADAKATPAERTKSEKEKVADEKARLEELENARLARMNAMENGRRHLPVDMDVGFDQPRKKKKAKFELRFDQSGQVMDKDKIEKNSLRKVARDSDASDEEEEIDDNGDEDLDDLLNDDEREEETNDDEEVEDEEDEENEDEEEEENEEESENDNDEEIEESDEAICKLKKSSNEIEANGDVPFVFTFPSNYNSLIGIFTQHGEKNVGTILERIVKCHHPGLKEGNKDLMKKLFLYTLRFYDEKSKEDVTAESVQILGVLTKSLYSVMKFNIEYGVRCVRAFIRQTWNAKSEEKRKKPASFTIITLLRLVACLFPVSDIWHPVCSPAIMLATNCISYGMITSLNALSRQILLLTTITDYVEESKRFIPEAMGFLQGALTLAVKDPDMPAPSNVFPISEPHCHMLLIEKAVTSEEALEPLKLQEIFTDKSLENNDVNRCRILRVLLACARRFRVIYAVHEETFTTLFTPIVALMKKIPASLLPATLEEDLESLIQSAEAECKARLKLVQMSRIRTEKSMLKMLEPEFEYNFDPERPRKNRDSSRKGPAAEKNKLNHLYKKEMRGAIRELRKDTKYLGRKQRQEVASKDRDRREKTKRLLSDLQSQQGEWNQEMREGGKKPKKK